MAHNINTYVGRQAAWHALGTVTGKYQTTDELLSDPGFQFVVFKSQLRDGLGRPVDAYGTFRWNLADKVNGRKEAAQFLGVVGKDYTVIQHDEGFKTVDALMQSVDGAHYETAGVLGNGETVWALADLGLGFNIGDDVHKNYLLFVTGHDGAMSYKHALCDERVVCHNTLKVALREKGFSGTIRHTKNAQARVVEARKMLEDIKGEVTTLKDRMSFLVGRKVTRESMTDIFDRLFPKKMGAEGVSVDTTRRSNILAEILRNYEANDNNAFPEQRGTAYAALNSITQYVDHQRSSKDDGRAESAMFGSGDLLKSRAMDVIYESAKTMSPVRSMEPLTVDWASLGMNVGR